LATPASTPVSAIMILPYHPARRKRFSLKALSEGFYGFL